MTLVELLRRKLVEDYKWLSGEEFSEGLSLATLLPGPVAVNTLVFCGARLFGRTIALLGVAAVLMPSFVLMILLTSAYQQLMASSGLKIVLMVLNGAVIGILIAAGLTLLKKSCHSNWHYLIVVISFGVLILSSSYLSMLLLLLSWIIIAQRWGSYMTEHKSPPAKIDLRRNFILIAGVLVFTVLLGVGSHYFFLLDILKTFSGISLTFFGGGYVILPLLKAVLVEGRHWLTDSDVLLGISMGQLSPGPILISSAFYGQKLAGINGAIAATVGMFLPPAFLMVAVAGFARNLKSFILYRKALDFIQPYVAALVLFAGVSTGFTWYSNIPGYIIVIPLVATFFSYYVRIQPIWLLASSIIIGLLLTL